LAETQLSVKLLAHTQVSESFVKSLWEDSEVIDALDGRASSGALVALTAIRTCYSHLKPSAIVATEGAKYFGTQATDGAAGTEADRLFRHIVRSKHTSTLEHLSFTFAIEGVSRALLAQLTRHRHASHSVQSQRYVRFGSEDKSGGFDYIIPPSVKNCTNTVGLLDISKRGMRLGLRAVFGRIREVTAPAVFKFAMLVSQWAYDLLRKLGIPAEDARFVFPNACATNETFTVNLRSLLEFYEKRRKGNGAQWEIVALAEALRDTVVAVEPWTAQFFGAGAGEAEVA
jgi:thymidylate synthase (FAD)